MRGVQGEEGQGVKSQFAIDRYRLVVMWRKEGRTFREIGGLLGVRAARASQIFAEAKEWKRERNGTSPLAGLSVWARKALRQVGAKNREEALDALASGRLHPRKTPWYGWKCHEEVVLWICEA